MQYLGSAYPLTFECLESAGCKESLIYQELDIECTAACGKMKDPRPGRKASVCHASFNSANQNAALSILLSCVFIIVSTTYLL